MAKVTFTTAESYERFQFHASDGKLIVVETKGYATDDPALIAYLDTQPAVKRAKSSGDGGKEG